VLWVVQLVMPLPPQSSAEVRKKYCQIMFETFNVPAAYFGHAAMLSVLYSGVRSVTGTYHQHAPRSFGVTTNTPHNATRTHACAHHTRHDTTNDTTRHDTTNNTRHTMQHTRQG
jgi:actin-related protein